MHKTGPFVVPIWDTHEPKTNEDERGGGGEVGEGVDVWTRLTKQEQEEIVAVAHVSATQVLQGVGGSCSVLPRVAVRRVL